MSLQDLANSLQNQGRGNDSMLVHMTPGEVAGLQSLALAHGGSLTTNPTTGLPEAGFLSDILPSIAGIGASMMGLGPLGVGLASGLTSYATNRDPNRALMSGLLSGGVSGLMGGLEKAGTVIPTQATIAEGSPILAREAAVDMLKPPNIYDTGFDLSKYGADNLAGKDRKSTRLNSSHMSESRMPSSA
mgnify:CR=1 FL=1